MPVLREADRQRLQELFTSQLGDPVTITYFTQYESVLTVPGQECTFCQETRDLWEALAGLSDKIVLQVYDFVRDKEKAEHLGIDKIPASVLSGHNEGLLRFFGIPSGYEFAVVVEDIVHLSTGTPRLAPTTVSALQSLDARVHIQVFVTPT